MWQQGSLPGSALANSGMLCPGVTAGGDDPQVREGDSCADPGLWRGERVGSQYRLSHGTLPTFPHFQPQRKVSCGFCQMRFLSLGLVVLGAVVLLGALGVLSLGRVPCCLQGSGVADGSPAHLVATPLPPLPLFSGADHQEASQQWVSRVLVKLLRGRVEAYD